MLQTVWRDKLEEFLRQVKSASISFHCWTTHSRTAFRKSNTETFHWTQRIYWWENILLDWEENLRSHPYHDFFFFLIIFLLDQWLSLKDILLSVHLKIGIFNINFVGVNFFYFLSKLNMRLMLGSEWQCILKICKTQDLITC